MGALGLLTLIPVVMWIGQTMLRRRAGLPRTWRITSSGLPRPLQKANRAIANGAFLAVLVLYGLGRRGSPMAHYVSLLPLDVRVRQALEGLAGSVIYLGLLYVGWIVTDNIRLRLRGRGLESLRRVCLAPLSAVLGAGVEELLFRGMLLDDLLHTTAVGPAVAVSTVVFAAAHYVRRVKRYWTIGGHLALGLLLCTAYACTRNLWLSFGLHAGGILLIMGTRPFMRYRGPAWLNGASIFPYAGGVGIVALLLLTLNIWLRHGPME